MSAAAGRNALPAQDRSAEPMRRVPPARGRGEAVGVLAALALIAVAMTVRAILVAAQEDRIWLQPYQRLDSSLTTDEQTLFRTLLAAEFDVADLRGGTGFWPDADALAGAFVPPFDAAMVPPALRGFRWSTYDGGSWVDYLGTIGDGAVGSEAFLLRLIDLHAGYHPHPHPGVDYDPEQLVAVQVWSHPDPSTAYPGERLPEAGWLWVVRRDDPLLAAQPAALPLQVPEAVSPSQWFLAPPTDGAEAP